MTLKKSEEIKKVTSFKLIENRLLYKKGDSLFTQNLYFNGDKIDINAITGYDLINHNLYFSCWNNETFILNIQNKEIKKIDFEQICEFRFHYNIVFRVGTNFFLENNTQILSNVPVYMNLSISDKFITTDESKENLMSINTLDNSISWNFALSQLPQIPLKEFANEDVPWEIKKIIGLLDNKLWVAMNHRTIIAISIETGDLVHIISEIPNFEMAWIHNSIPSPESTQIIENENILLGFVDSFVWKINAETGEISIKDYTPYFKENQIMNYRNEFIIDKELLFFLSDKDSKVGCFNRNTEQLEWQHAFEKDETGYAPRLVEIQGNRNKLGVKDLNNTLYIFENVN